MIINHPFWLSIKFGRNKRTANVFVVHGTLVCGGLACLSATSKLGAVKAPRKKKPIPPRTNLSLFYTLSFWFSGFNRIIYADHVLLLRVSNWMLVPMKQQT